MTLEQWADMDEDESGELVDGWLEEEEMPTFLHELIALWFATVLKDWVVPRGGVAFGSEVKLIVSGRRGRKADASAYLPGQKMPGRELGATRRPPSIVVEVLSPRPRDVRRDRVEKLREYAAFGVTYFWIVDPQARVLEIHELHAHAPHVLLLSESEGTHAVPGCEGLVLDLDALWAEADRLPEDEGEESAEP
jgi:Uma2 family endonuclease